MKKILIFGGYGFIGSKLYEKLKISHDVKRYSSLKKNKNFINYSYKNFLKIIKKFNPDIIMFLSGTTNVDYKNIFHLKDIKKINIPLQNILNAIRVLNFKGKFFFFSSIGVYGTGSNKKATEKTRARPESLYALAKVNGENQCKFYREIFKININILRLCSIFGPGLKKQIIYKIIKFFLSDRKEINLLGSKNDKREFLYIDDLYKIIRKMIFLDIKNETINIGSGKQQNIESIIKIVSKILNKNKKINYKNKIKAPIFPVLDIAKMKKLIKLSTNFDLKYGLIKSINYIKKND